MGYSDENTYEKILARVLSNDGLANVDKRVGSIVYDAVAPLCLELAEAYAALDMLESQSYLGTATGSNLDKRAYDHGIVRKKATKAQRICEFKKYEKDENGDKVLVDMDIPTGTRFSVPDDSTTFVYLGKIDTHNVVECEQAGTKGNAFLGSILPLNPIQGLATARIVSTYTPGEDDESDDELRERTIENLSTLPFGGNISDYINKVSAINGVGQLKVFPAWRERGAVLLSVVDPQFNPITEEFVQKLKEIIDPEEYTGQGVGTAPIGHVVTVTTPVKKMVDISFTVYIDEKSSVLSVSELARQKIEEYFESVRMGYKQDATLSIFRARISERILAVDGVLNVTDILLNGDDDDIIYKDRNQLGQQFLPYVGEMKVEQA